MSTMPLSLCSRLRSGGVASTTSRRCVARSPAAALPARRCLRAAAKGTPGAESESSLDPEERLESMERRLRSFDPAKDGSQRFGGPLAPPAKPPPLEPWSKRLEGKPALEAAWMLWIGEEGVLWWLNKITNTFSSLLATKPKLTKKPLVLEHNMTLRDALAALRKHGFLGAPLFIYPTLGGDTFGEGLMDVTERPTYCGWIDMNDIVLALVRELPPVMGMPPEYWHAELAEAERKIAGRMLITLRSQNDGAVVYKANENISLADLIEHGFVVSRSHPTHRVASFDDTGAVTGIVTQLDVVRVAAESGVLADVWACDAGSSPVISVACTVPCVEALMVMAARNVSSVAVVDAEGKLTATLSASDTRGVEAFTALAMPVGEYLAGTGQRGVITVHASASLLDAARLMAQGHVHRVYVLDGRRRPLRCITCTDVLRVLLQGRGRATG